MKNMRDKLLEEMRKGEIPTEFIPYEVALVGIRELTEDEIEYGKKLESLALEYLEEA